MAQISNKTPSVNFLDRRKQLHGYHQMLVVSFNEWWLSLWWFATLNQQKKRSYMFWLKCVKVFIITFLLATFINFCFVYIHHQSNVVRRYLFFWISLFCSPSIYLIRNDSNISNNTKNITVYFHAHSGTCTHKHMCGVGCAVSAPQWGVDWGLWCWWCGFGRDVEAVWPSLWYNTGPWLQTCSAWQIDEKNIMNCRKKLELDTKVSSPS